MNCEICNEKMATTYCVLKVNGKNIQKNLCIECKNALCFDDEISVSESFKLKNQFCHNCGTTLKDFVISGYVGCEFCYEEFDRILSRSMLGIQKNAENLSKIPPIFAKKQEICELETLLDKAMSNGDLIQVNRLSAKLKLIKGER